MPWITLPKGSIEGPNVCLPKYSFWKLEEGYSHSSFSLIYKWKPLLTVCKMMNDLRSPLRLASTKKLLDKLKLWWDKLWDILRNFLILKFININ